MADLILNLISLKSKCDAAGVGTTATNATPSLCPTKSAIPGYVTNGASVVKIYNASSYANNLLVPEANVSVNKTPTGTGIVYRNVSVGTSSAPDIPASGGSSRASAIVTYLQTTRTYYSDGSYTDGTWTDQSETIYGEYTSVNSKGTTVSNRTSTGSTSTPSGTVAGATRTGTAVTIYLAANSKSISSLYTYTYSLAYIPASGGTNAVPDFYVEATYTYTSGSTSTETVTNSATIKYGKNDSRTLPDSLSTNSSACQYTVESNDTTDELLIGYAFVHATYSGLTSYDSSKVRLSAGSGVVVTGSYFEIAVLPYVPDISADGGYSETPEVVGAMWVTQYSDGTTSITDITSSLVTWSYGKVDKGSYTTSNPPSVTVPQYYSGTIYGLFYANSTNSTSRTLLGWTFIKAEYNGSTDYARCEVYQSPRVSTPEVYKVHVVPLTYNGTTYATPILTFYNGSSTIAGQGHGRVNGTQTLNYYSWSLPKVTGLYIVENGSHEYVRYITVRAHDGSILLEKYYIGGSSVPGYVPLLTSFNTSDYSSGQTIYIYYYYS